MGSEHIFSPVYLQLTLSKVVPWTGLVGSRELEMVSGEWERGMREKRMYKAKGRRTVFT